MSLQVAYSIFFVMILVTWFWRERARWNKFQSTKKTVDEALPLLVAKAAGRYEAKFGRPPSVLESAKQR